MDDTILIEAVRNRREIYDKGHAGFKNPAIKDSAWRVVAEAVSATVSECTARWNTLRERFAKEKRLQEAETRSGASTPKRPTWIHMQALSFLNPHMRHRKSIVNLPSPSYGSLVQLPLASPPLSTSSLDDEVNTLLLSDSMEIPVEFSEQSDDGPAEISISDNTFRVIAHGLPSSSSSLAAGTTKSAAASLPYLGSSGRCKKQKVDDTAEMFKEALSNLNKSIALPPPPLQTQQLKDNDSDSLIGQSVTLCLKALPNNHVKLRFRKRFRELVQECEEVLLEEQNT